MPKAASTKACSLSCRACGAWSVATASMVPSASAVAQRVDVLVGPQRRVDLEDRVVAGEQVGGEHQVVRRHLGGDVDALRLGPADHLDRAGGARRGRRAPGCRCAGRASTSRATIDLLGDRRASRAARGGRRARPRGSRRAARRGAGSCACWETTPPKARTYSSARRITRASCDAVAVVGEDPDPRPGSGAMRPSSASSSPARPLVTAPTGWTSTSPAARPRSRMRSAASAVSVTGLVLAIASTAVKPPTRGGPRAGGDGLGVLAARLAQVGVEVDESRAARPARRRRARRRPASGVDAPTSAITPSSTQQVAAARAARRGVDQVAPRDDQRAHCGRSLSPASRW